MAESVGMQIINQRCEDIIRAMGLHELTLVDMARIQARFLNMSNLVVKMSVKIKLDLERGGDGS